MIEKSLIEIRLKAIEDKNVADIIKKHTFIPNIGFDYTSEQLTQWLKVRSDALKNILAAKDAAEVKATVDTLKTSFGTIPTLKDADELDAESYDKLSIIRIYDLILGDTALWLKQ